jgi:hypothetical protein
VIVEGDKESRNDRLIEKQTAGISTCRQCIKSSYENQYIGTDGTSAYSSYEICRIRDSPVGVVIGILRYTTLGFIGRVYGFASGVVSGNE